MIPSRKAGKKSACPGLFAVIALFSLFPQLSSYAATTADEDPDLTYFKQFLFQKIEKDDGDDHIVVTYAYLWDMNRIPLPGDDLLRFSEARVILRPDGTVTVLANAGKWAPGYPPSFCLDRYDSTWTVVDHQLRIGTAIVGERAFEEGKHGVRLKFLENMGMFQMKGEEVTTLYREDSEEPIHKYETQIEPVCRGGWHF